MFNLGTILTALGLVPAEARTVTDVPADLKALVPAPVDNNVTVKPTEPDVEKDTLPLIVEKTKRTAYQTRKLAAKLKGSTLAETLRNNSNFILRHIKYRKDDPNHEQIRSPRRLIYEGQGDCDCFAVCIGSLLKNQNIEFRFRIAKYRPGDWAHIYIVVPKNQRNSSAPLASRADYYVLDPVTNRHDHEASFIDKKDFTMGLQFLDGIPSRSYSSLGELACCCNSEEKKAAIPSPVTPIPLPGGKVKYVISGKSLENRGLMAASDFLKTTGLAFREKETTDGVPYYEVSTPSGVQNIPGFISVDPIDQQALTAQLMAPPSAPSNTSKQTRSAIGVMLTLGVATALISMFRGKPSEKNGLGALDKRILPVVQL